MTEKKRRLFDKILIFIIFLSGIYFSLDLLERLLIRYSTVEKGDYRASITIRIVIEQQVQFYFRNNKFTNNFDDLSLGKIKGNKWLVPLKGGSVDNQSDIEHIFKISSFDSTKLVEVKAIEKESNYLDDYHAVIRVDDKDKNSPGFYYIRCPWIQEDEKPLAILTNFIAQDESDLEKLSLRLQEIDCAGDTIKVKDDAIILPF